MDYEWNVRLVLLCRLSSPRLNLSHYCSFYKCSAVAEMGDRLAIIDTGRELRALPLMGDKLDPHVTQCCLGQGLYLPTKWRLDASSHLATTDMSRKLGAVPLVGGYLGPRLTQCGQDRGLPAGQVSS